MIIPKLNNLITALECEDWRPSVCEHCEYGFLDDHGDYPIWSCNETRLREESLFYLKLYQYLIEEQENG